MADEEIDYDTLDPDDDEDDGLTDDERREKAEKVQQRLSESADETLNRWHEAAPQETRELVIGKYVMDGEIDPHVAGVDPVEVQVVQAAFAGHIERNVLAPVGLTMDAWLEHIDEAELPAFRQAVVQGDWKALIDHARAAAKMRRDLGI